MEQIFGLITEIPELIEEGKSIKLLFCINIIPDCMAGLLRGVIKALAIQDQIVLPHMICQGLLSNLLTYYFGFYLFPMQL